MHISLSVLANLLALSFRFRLQIPRLQHAHAFIEIGQANRQGEAFAFVAFDRQFAAVFSYDPAHD